MVTCAGCSRISRRYHALPEARSRRVRQHEVRRAFQLLQVWLRRFPHCFHGYAGTPGVVREVGHRRPIRLHRRHLRESSSQRDARTSPRPRRDRPPSLLAAPPRAVSTSRSIRKRFTWKNDLWPTRNGSPPPHSRARPSRPASLPRTSRRSDAPRGGRPCRARSPAPRARW